MDGCPGGWVGAQVSAGAVEWRLFRSARELVDASTATAATAVDAPIGLTDAGPRDCDRAARALLRRRGSSVFPAPVRSVLAATSYAEACRISREAQGKALSIQAWNITGKIAELDAALTDNPDAVVECHPEVSFLLLAGSALPPKKSADGVAARIAALSRWIPDVTHALERRPAGPRVDDVLDALVCAWTANRVRSGTAQRLPEGRLQRDRLGRPMQIVG